MRLFGRLHERVPVFSKKFTYNGRNDAADEAKGGGKYEAV